jgi:hypothetical protein
MKLSGSIERQEWATLAQGALAASGNTEFACAAADYMMEELRKRADGRHDAEQVQTVAPGSALTIPKIPKNMPPNVEPPKMT